MALTKVTVDALLSLRKTMKQACDNMVEIKQEVDSFCYGFEWDDPIGRSFILKYEEGMKPIKEKLLPMLEQYYGYLGELTGSVGEYNETNVFSSSALGVSSGIVGVASIAGIGKTISGFSVLGPEKKKVDHFLVANKDGSISWNDERFEKLEKENSEFLKSEEGKEWKKNADEAFSKIDDLSSMTYGELHQVVGGTLGLKEDEITYQLKPRENKPGYVTFGWHPKNSDKAILNDNQKVNMPVCAQIATFAHEGRHVYQDMVINDDGKRFKYDDELKKYVKEMKEGRDNYTTGSVDFDKYYSNPIEIDARRMEIVVGKACTDRYNALEKLKHHGDY